MKVSDLFRDPELAWGLRGDPFLWEALEKRFQGVELPCTSIELVQMVENEYRIITGQAIEIDTYVYVKELAHGGMSSGHICPEYWRDSAIPLLVERYRRYRGDTSKSYLLDQRK